MKRFVLVILGLTLALSLTACAANPTPTPSPSPMVTPMMTPFPSGTDLMGATPAPTDGAPAAAMTGEQSAALSRKASDAAAMISEIDVCVAAIVGDTCAVGVTFDAAYQGELTDRIRDMVTARIQDAVPTISRVAVTVDPELSAQIGAFASKVSSAGTVGELIGEMDSLVGKIN